MRAAEQAYERALDFRAAGKLNDAIAAARVAVSESADQAEPLHVLGALLLDAGDRDAAAAPLSRAEVAYRERIAARPEDGEAWFQLACVQALLLEDAEALVSLRRALDLDNSFQSYQLRSRARGDEDLARLLAGGDEIDDLVPDLPDAIERARLYAIFEAHQPVFERVERFDYYLANAIGARFLLPAANVAEAYRRLTSAERAPRSTYWSTPPADGAEAALRQHAEMLMSRLDREGREGKASLDEVFAANFMKLVRDEAGNVVDITGQDGDVNAVWLLEEIADLITEGSWFLYLDDMRRYWRATVQSSKLVYELGRSQAGSPTA